MTKLSTHLKLEDIKKSKKLQRTVSDEVYIYSNTQGMYLSRDFSAIIELDAITNEFEYFFKPTIADIIDNAEELFGGKQKDTEGISKRSKMHAMQICLLAVNRKSIEEISDYILTNIKKTNKN